MQVKICLVYDAVIFSNVGEHEYAHQSHRQHTSAKEAHLAY